MPPKKSSTGEGDQSAASFTDSEIKMLKAVFDSMNSRPDINFENVANVMGLANAKGARDRFRAISKKHGWTSTDGSSTGSPAKASGALAAKNTGKVAKKPTPKKKKGAALKKAKKETDDSDDEEDVSAKLDSDSDGKTIPKDEPMGSSDEEE